MCLIMDTAHHLRVPPQQIFFNAMRYGVRAADKIEPMGRFYHQRWLVDEKVAPCIIDYCRYVQRTQGKRKTP